MPMDQVKIEKMEKFTILLNAFLGIFHVPGCVYLWYSGYGWVVGVGRYIGQVWSPQSMKIFQSLYAAMPLTFSWTEIKFLLFTLQFLPFGKSGSKGIVKESIQNSDR